MLAMDSSNGHLAALYDIPVVTLWGVTHPYAGFTPFNQPNEHQLVANREVYPLIPTSVYGNKFPAGYEEAMRGISVETVLQKMLEII
jgi:ADP-heptose:LPS heptosyltransferase